MLRQLAFKVWNYKFLFHIFTLSMFHDLEIKARLPKWVEPGKLSTGTVILQNLKGLAQSVPEKSYIVTGGFFFKEKEVINIQTETLNYKRV